MLSDLLYILPIVMIVCGVCLLVAAFGDDTIRYEIIWEDDATETQPVKYPYLLN